MGYKLVLLGNRDNYVLNKANATIVGKNRIKTIDWCVVHYKPNISDQTILSKLILGKIPTELQYIGKTVCVKEVNIQDLWTFALGTQEGQNVLIWSNVEFQQRDGEDSQKLNKDTFFTDLQLQALNAILGSKGIMIPPFY